MDIEYVLIDKLKETFGSDLRRINHALSVLEFAKSIHKIEGGSSVVILASAILHDIGIKMGEWLYNSNAPKYQQNFGPVMAKQILDSIESITNEEKHHICRIIGSHHTANDIDTIEFRTIWDADWLVNLPEEYPSKTKNELINIINKVFKTQTGKSIALAQL